MQFTLEKLTEHAHSFRHGREGLFLSGEQAWEVPMEGPAPPCCSTRALSKPPLAEVNLTKHTGTAGPPPPGTARASAQAGVLRSLSRGQRTAGWSCPSRPPMSLPGILIHREKPPVLFAKPVSFPFPKLLTSELPLVPGSILQGAVLGKGEPVLNHSSDSISALRVLPEDAAASL